jgi:hypothetical protein
MSYATGVPTSPTDLLQQLDTFLAANGWTSDKSAAEGFGWGAHLHKGSTYVHLKAIEAEAGFVSEQVSNGYALLLYLSDAFDTGQTWVNQPGNRATEAANSNAIGAGMNLAAGPFSNYYFFTDGTNDNVVVVVEKTPGLYVHIAWGTSLKKAGAWTGGMYFHGSASGYLAPYQTSPANQPGFTKTTDCPGCVNDVSGYPCGLVLCDVDTWTGKWVSIGDITAGFAYTGRNGTSSVIGQYTPSASIPRYAASPFSAFTNPQPFQFAQTSVLDGRANLLPVNWFAGRDGATGSTGGFSLIGSLPMIFSSTGVGSGFLPASDYVIGSDTYTIFPNFAVLKV